MLKCTNCCHKNTCTDALRYFNDLDDVLERMKVNTTADIKLFAKDIENVLKSRRWDCDILN